MDKYYALRAVITGFLALLLLSLIVPEGGLGPLAIGVFAISFLAWELVSRYGGNTPPPPERRGQGRNRREGGGLVYGSGGEKGE